MSFTLLISGIIESNEISTYRALGFLDKPLKKLGLTNSLRVYLKSGLKCVRFLFGQA